MSLTMSAFPGSASSDVADVSWNTPVAVFGWPTYPLGLNLHTWAVTACGGTSIGDKGTLAAAAILAAVGYERAANGDRRMAAKDRNGDSQLLGAARRRPVRLPYRSRLAF